MPLPLPAAASEALALPPEKASFPGRPGEYHRRVKCTLLILVGLTITQKVGASEFGRPVNPPGYLNGQGPSVLNYLPASVPDPPIPPVGRHDPAHPLARPVARLDGVPVYRPLFPSRVEDPVERALIVRDYRQSHFHLPDLELSLAFKRYQRAQFHGIDALRDLRLQKEGATLDDYRRYVAEELAINAMLHTNCRGAVTRAERNALQRNYLTRLRRKAVAEPLPS